MDLHGLDYYVACYGHYLGVFDGFDFECAEMGDGCLRFEGGTGERGHRSRVGSLGESERFKLGCYAAGQRVSR